MKNDINFFSLNQLENFINNAHKIQTKSLKNIYLDGVFL